MFESGGVKDNPSMSSSFITSRELTSKRLLVIRSYIKLSLVLATLGKKTDAGIKFWLSRLGAIWSTTTGDDSEVLVVIASESREKAGTLLTTTTEEFEQFDDLDSIKLNEERAGKTTGGSGGLVLSDITGTPVCTMDGRTVGKPVEE